MARSIAKRPSYTRATTDSTMGTQSNTRDHTLNETTDRTPFLQDTSDRSSHDTRRPETSFDVEDNDTRQPLQARNKSRSRLHALAASPIWLLSTLILLTVLIAQNVVTSHQPSYEHGFPTEISALKPAIKLRQTRFKSAIRDLPNGTMHVPEPALDSKGRHFTGPPSDEIDNAWLDLIHGRYERFSDSEVAWLDADPDLPPATPVHERPAEWMQGEAGVYAGPDLLHSLHCLNGLRKHLDYEYYEGKGMLMSGPGAERMHVDHCLEQLRQAVLCHADLTPSVLKPVFGAGGSLVALLGQTERVHVCRDGEAIVEAWMRQRGWRGWVGE